ncbi:hypothetical protein JSY36_09230 [Bacillus sp. H-16]|uniref:hypothetical protein n=1 Tax=Alteribacter salitolerans TaxID=2912333 RepID=UPI0019644C55|nr:hypothetical protein [Alteribacter salitolerans]MBM7095936.1 hypothetical protein [Alteribacter salitolerans]
MDFISWYDWITPTNPLAALFFGILGTVVVSVLIWLEMRDTKIILITLAAGVTVSIAGVSFLHLLGVYG